MSDLETYETTQPWVTYRYGRTVDTWWPWWKSTRVLGRGCIVAICCVCGDRHPIWFKIPRLGKVPDNGKHPLREAYLRKHVHPDKGHMMSWALPLRNPFAMGGLDFDLLAARLEADLNEGRDG
jgi:hypothetical protein